MSGLELEELRAVHSRVAASDDDDVRSRVLLERAGGRDLAGLLEPPPVAGVAHAQ